MLARYAMDRPLSSGCLSFISEKLADWVEVGPLLGYHVECLREEWSSSQIQNIVHVTIKAVVKKGEWKVHNF